MPEEIKPNLIAGYFFLFLIITFVFGAGFLIESYFNGNLNKFFPKVEDQIITQKIEGEVQFPVSPTEIITVTPSPEVTSLPTLSAPSSTPIPTATAQPTSVPTTKPPVVITTTKPLPTETSKPLSSLKLSCSITNTQPKAGQNVSVNCFAKDQSGNPVNNVILKLSIVWQSGSQVLNMPSSNSSGTSQITIVVPEGNKGIVTANITAEKDGLKVNTNFTLNIQ
ncbi:MAG: hypothetical protein N3A71_01985 [Candidatus Dojkabacteria bacterium]|nr:hypothetical protein [Candidatus Dojkabacteria bacterium]